MLLRGRYEKCCEYDQGTSQMKLGRRMNVQKMFRKRIPLHPSWNTGTT